MAILMEIKGLLGKRVIVRPLDFLVPSIRVTGALATALGNLTQSLDHFLLFIAGVL